jgi:hypothetical protein
MNCEVSGIHRGAISLPEAFVGVNSPFKFIASEIFYASQKIPVVRFPILCKAPNVAQFPL